MFADVWKTTPLVVLILLAGLQAIPEDLYQQAKVDGVGLEKPSGGELFFDHELIADAAGKFNSPFERDISMVLQSYALYPHMTVAQNIAFSLTNLPKVPIMKKLPGK